MKWILVLAAAFVLMITGCERSLDSESLEFDPPEEVPTPVALKIFHLADGMELEWQISDTPAVAYFNVYHALSEEAESYDYLDSTSDFSLTVTTLNAGQQYYFAVTAVDTNDIEGEQSAVISTRVGVSSIIINDNDEYTNSRRVSLDYAVPVTPLLVKISEHINFTDAIWQNYRRPESFTLSGGDGIKRVYALFRFEDGSESQSAVGDSIILDTRAYIDSTWFEPIDTDFGPGDTIMFYIDAAETDGEAFVSFPGLTRLNLYDDGGGIDETADDGIYTGRYIVPIDIELEDGLVTGSFTDAAGNEADDYPASQRMNIVVPVDEISLQAVAESSWQVRLDWSEVDGDDFVSYRIYRDTEAGVDETSELITTITSRTTLTYTDDNLDDNQLYVYKVYVYGSDGLVTTSNEASSTTMLNQPPSAVTIAVGLIDSLTIEISWSQNTDDDFVSYQIYRGDDPSVTDLTGQRLTIINGQATTTYTDFRYLPSETYYYVIYVYDRHGLKSEKSNVESTP